MNRSKYSFSQYFRVFLYANLLILSSECLSDRKSVTQSDGSKIEYEVVSEEPFRVHNKSSLRVRIDRRVNTIMLRKIGRELQNSRKGYDQLYIYYYLPDMNPQGMAWATTHFTPNLEVDILGKSAEQYDRMMSAKGNEGVVVVGTWYDATNEMKIGIVERKNRYYMQFYTGDGEHFEREMKKKTINKKDRYIDIKSKFNEYFEIEPNGSLSMFEMGKKYRESRPIH